MTNSQKKETPLLPAYLVVGKDALKRDVVMKRLRSRLATMGDLSFNSDVFESEGVLGGDIVASCNTLPFASDVRLVEVHHVEKLKKADSEELVSYLTNPCETTVLAVTGEALAKNTRLYKAFTKLGKNAVIECEPLKKHELPKSVKSMAVGHGFTMTTSAAEKLIELVGENTVHLNNELKKLSFALDRKTNDPVTEMEVSQHVRRTAEVKNWEFVDAFTARDLKQCSLLLGRMPSASPHALLAMCVTRIRELICAKACINRGNQRGIAAALKVPDWRVKNHARWAQRFTSQELRGALISARDAERAMKSGSDAQAVFFQWIIEVSTPRR